MQKLCLPFFLGLKSKNLSAFGMCVLVFHIWMCLLFVPYCRWAGALPSSGSTLKLTTLSQLQGAICRVSTQKKEIKIKSKAEFCSINCMHTSFLQKVYMFNFSFKNIKIISSKLVKKKCKVITHIFMNLFTILVSFSCVTGDFF